MRLIGKSRAVSSLLLCLSCAVVSSTALSTPVGGLVWFSDHESLKGIEVDTNRVALNISLQHEPDGLAVDPNDNSVWALLDKSLVKFSRAGTELRRIDLQGVHASYGKPRLITLNPYNGSVWVATGKDLIQFSPTGQSTVRWAARQKINAIALDIDESVWVAAQDDLFHLSPAGSVLASVNLKDFGSLRHLAVDGLGGIIWVSDTRRLAKLNLLQVTAPPQFVDAPALVRDWDRYGGEAHNAALAVHPVLGTLWLATETDILLFDRSGSPLKTIALPRAVGKVTSMVFDPRSLSLWIAGKNGVGRFTGGGEFVAGITAEKEADYIAAGRFTLRPTLSILDPSESGLTNNPRPRLRLSLGAQCSGAPCLLPEAYVSSLHLNMMLNGEAIGAYFAINATEAFYVPTSRLPEGMNTLSGRATDLFGHNSEEATARFVVDTVPPKFVSITPADGTVVANGTVNIRGLVDDATANVILADGNGNGIGMSTASFNFSVLLKTGLNTFRLTARDPAGNETTTPVRIFYNPATVKITAPVLGATLTQRGTTVTGELQAPANTGITVNGVIAQVVGNRFYVNVALQPGANTLTAVATTPEGASVTDSITVTVDAPATASFDFTAEPYTGVAPLTVNFSAHRNTSQPTAQLRVDVGDGKTVLMVTAESATHTYEAPGVYRAEISATDSAGATASQTVAVVVNDGRQMDQQFSALWGGMNDALRQGNILAAASFLNDSAKRKYQPVFEALKPHFAQIIASYSPLRRVSITADIGEYAVVRTNNGRNQLYLIYFVRDADGVWRVDGM